ncbi:MAG: DUF1800 family protein [Saprospiraceae bacterium]|nr:DUF1800 family protein [Lewinella sp.]
MKNVFLSLCIPLLIALGLLIGSDVKAQLYYDYYGNGHNTGMKVKSSGSNTAMSDETLTGTGITPDRAGASRFLAQATLGHNLTDINTITSDGIEAWIDAQMSMPYTRFSKAVQDNQLYIRGILGDEFNRGELNNFTFYTKVFSEEDKLRQKMASALLQVMVISLQVQQIGINGYEASTYYDIFYDGAFGNYRDILEKVTLHPMMGVYLSHFRNAQANYTRNTYPDENYAREIMQLFTIGLVQLNLDGTPKLDSEGKEIPTYDNDDIREIAKVFTGLAGAEREDGSAPSFTYNADQVNLALPMLLFPVEHDITEKSIINDIVLPPGRSGLDDLEATLDILFNHPNVGPFVSIRLIQQFVKSNPSPAYVKRVATVFNDNGKGVRGDMGAVIKAILLDPEARECDWSERPESGKLLQPYERFTKLFCAFTLATNSGKFFLRDEEYFGKLGQSFFNSPSVFNFFSPFFAEEKVVKPMGLVSPEFEIFNSVTSIEYFNQMEDRVKGIPFDNKTQRNGEGDLTTNNRDKPQYNFKKELQVLNNEGISGLMNHLNILLCRGQLSNRSSSIIQNSLQQYRNNITDYTNLDLIKDAVYFICVSPDFIIQN